MTNREAIGVPEDAGRITVDGVELAVCDEGSGPAVVCLHATGHGGGDFAALAEALRGKYRVVRVDWPGQGRSGTDRQPPTPERYARLLEGLLAGLGIGSPILVGCSIGGAAAIHYAARRPVRALVLCNPGGLVPASWIARIFCGLFARFFRAGERGAGWFDAAFSLYYRKLVLPSPAAAAQRDRIIAAGRELAPLLAAAWSHFGLPEADIRGLALGLDVPVWFAWARHDRIIPLSLCRPAIRRMRRASLTLFDGGHAAFLEQPAHFSNAFERFAATLPAG